MRSGRLGGFAMAWRAAGGTPWGSGMGIAAGRGHGRARWVLQAPGVAHRRAGGPAEHARAVTQARLGDPDALRFLYVRYADSVYGYVESLVHDRHEAEDITQQVFTKLVSSSRSTRSRTPRSSPWILTVSRHVALDEVRRRRAIPCEEVLSPACGGVGADPLDSILVWEALAQLPDEQRQVVVLRHLAGLSPSEIASSRALGAVDPRPASPGSRHPLRRHPPARPGARGDGHLRSCR